VAKKYGTCSLDLSSEPQLEIAGRVGYLDEPAFKEAQKLTDECSALTYGLKKTIRKVH